MGWFSKTERNGEWYIGNDSESFKVENEPAATRLVELLNEDEPCPMCDADEYVIIGAEDEDRVDCPVCQALSPEERAASIAAIEAAGFDLIYA
jgi:hypothetical protein